eukprot:5716244-Pyramimonas_sp.AAC.1
MASRSTTSSRALGYSSSTLTSRRSKCSAAPSASACGSDGDIQYDVQQFIQEWDVQRGELRVCGQYVGEAHHDVQQLRAQQRDHDTQELE